MAPQPQQLTAPLWIENGRATRLHRQRFDDRTFDEGWLQKLLFEHPELVPARELEPIYDVLIPVARELPTAAGPIDILYLTPKGNLVLVETKLWRNPEARRTVVAQIIDYAKELARWSYQDLCDAVRVARGGTRGVGVDPLLQLVHEEDDPVHTADFHDLVSRNLRRGRFLLLIVGDGIREDVEHMTEFLQQTPQLGFTLGVVEIGLYRAVLDHSSPLLVQPRILARTREVVRAIVEVRNSTDAKIEVTIPETSEREPDGKRTRISEQEFFEDLARSTTTEATELARWILAESERLGWTVDWMAGGPAVKFREPETGAWLTLFQLRMGGRIYSLDRFYGRCEKLDLPTRVWRQYFDSLATLVPGAECRQFDKCYSVTTGPKIWNDAIRLEQLVPVKETWLACMERAVRDFQEAVSERVERSEA